MKQINSLFVICLLLKSTYSFSWGGTGHKIVAEIAKSYLEKSVQDSVQKYLGEMSFEEAAVWMDEIKKDKTLDYLKPYHYVNVEKDKTYVKVDDKNILEQLQITISQLKNRKSSTKDEINLQLKMLFHLVGDLHQPLHVGYGADKGGNSIDVQFLEKKSNLHRVWDSDIIDYKKITTADCLKLAEKLSAKKLKKISEIDVAKWMKESRSYLKKVYAVKDGKIDEAYIDKNADLVKKQLLFAGIRLASVLNASFK